MKKTISLLALLFCFAHSSVANESIKTRALDKDSIELTNTVAPVAMPLEALNTRQFDFNEELFAVKEGNFTSFDNPIPSLQQLYHEKRAEALAAKVKAENRFVKYLDEHALIDLPVGVVGEGGKEDYAILVDSLVITPDGAYLTVYLCIPIPQSEKKLIFRGDNIKLSKNAGITGDARIFLVNDIQFKLFERGANMAIRGGADKTSAIWDCNGFKEINLVADVEFSRDWIVPVKGDSSVTCRFKATFNNWSNLVVNVNLQPFSLPSLRGVEFTAKQVTFDFSDLYTPEYINFPKGYNSSQFINGDKKLWRGFYMEELKVLLPPEIRTKVGGSGKDTVRVSFTGQNLLIDHTGFSGSLGVTNLFGLDQGDMNGWDYSIDSIGIQIVSNNLTGAGFRGNMVLPIGDKGERFTYTAIINPGTAYVFNIKVTDSLTFEFLKAKVVLQKGSYLEVQVTNGKFRPKAVLTGSMDIRSSSDQMSLFDVKFEELTISSEAPYLDAKAFSFGSEKLQHAMKDFPVSISKIGFAKKGDNNAVLSFNVAVHLTGDDGGGFGGDATFDIKCVRNNASGKSHKWKYDGVSVSEIGIDIDGGSYTIKGRIKFFEQDPIYGKGCNGTVQLTFEPGFLLDGTVVFGNVDGYRYWYTDAFVGFPQGIPFCGFLAFYGFGGGMYHNMEQVGFSSEAKYSAGKTLSGIIYKPNKKIRYGLKATVQIGLTSSKETFNGDVTFEISFNEGGGLKRISLVGNAYLFMNAKMGDNEEMTAMVQKMSQHKDSYEQAAPGDIHATSGLKPPGKDAPISGHLFQYYDFENKVLHGEMEMYVDVFGVLKGIGPNGLAGWSVVHYSKEEWFIYIGTPKRRIGLSVLGMMTMDSYFMVGTEIEGSPAPPKNVSEILNNGDFDYMRDENALGTGKGVAFGASFLFDTGNQSFLMFYGRFSMGAGFDVMLKNYGKDVHCKGQNSTLGINGWYANGQAYAFVEGRIGIKVKLFFKTKKVEILRIGAAVVLQAKLPNPIWMKGVVGGHFSVLGGVVKGRCKFELEIGDKCKIINSNVLEGVNVIADMTPMQGSREVDVFTSPQAVFNLEVGKEFQMTDVDDVNKTFRIKLDRFQVKNGNEIIPASLTWNEDKTVLVIENAEVLPPQKELVAEVKVTFEEKVNGKWVPVKVNGKEVSEEMKTTFTTGTAPDYIPKENIAYSYPEINQYNFYPAEYQQGYIKLKKGQSYLFGSPEVWVPKARFIPAKGETLTADLNYSNSQVNYAIPAIPNDQVYTLELVNLPKDNGGSIDRNVKTVSSSVEVEGQKTETEIASKKAEGSITTVTETSLYKSYFRASKYNTFNEKLDHMTVSSGWSKPDSRGHAIHLLGTNISASEFFAYDELYGSGMNPLVSIVANLSDNSYYKNLVYPLVYEDYASLTVPAARLEMRDLSLGVPPVKAVYINQYPLAEPVVSSEGLLKGSATSRISTAAFNYELIYYMKSDYLDLQSKTAKYYTYQQGVLTERRRKLLETTFPVVIQGNYQVDISYTLPGINKTTTTRSYNIYNPFK